MQRIDCYIIDNLFTPFANRIQTLTGKSCYHLAQLCFIICAVICVVIGVYGFLNGHYSLTDGLLLIFLFYVNSHLFLISSEWMQNEQSKLEKGKESKCMSRVDHEIFRTTFLVLIPFLIMLVPFIGDKTARELYSFITLTITCFEFALYFFACTPLPPGKSRIQEMKEDRESYYAKTETQENN